MELLSFLFENPHLNSILVFLSGIAIKFLYPRAKINKKIITLVTFYLVAAIGLKGGLSISQPLPDSYSFLYLIICGILIGLLQPFLSYLLLRSFVKLDRINAAVISAQYGSVSLITFAAAASFLKKLNIDFEGSIFSIMAIMELPAIFSGLFIALKHTHSKTSVSRKHLLKSIFFNKIISVLLVFFFVGYAFEKWHLTSHFSDLLKPFPIVLDFFLFYMGITIASQKEKLKQLNYRLCLFGIYMPMLGALISMGIAACLGLDQGTTLLFTVLGASASYIAVPAVMKFALPNANEAIYFPLAIGITFPFNITIGIPLYYKISALFFR